MKRLILGLACALMLCGCTKSNIVTPDTNETEMITGVDPDMSVKDDVDLDWTQIGNDMDEIFTDPQAYPMSESVNYSLDEEKSAFSLTLIVKEGTTADEAVAYATDVVKGLNDEAATQDFSFARSSVDSYGGFFDKYDLKVLVIPGSTYKDSSDYLVDQVILKGTNEPIQANES